MKWIKYPSRRAFEKRTDGIERRGTKWSDAPPPGAVWAIPEDGPRRYVLVRSYRGYLYEIEGDKP